MHALTPEGFERFCRFLLERLYRGRGDGRAYGGPGHKQDGIDILVTGAIGVHTYQCKRVEKFGAQKVHAAVATQTYPADQKVLLLSSTASPDARDAIAMHPGWQLWDSPSACRGPASSTPRRSNRCPRKKMSTKSIWSCIESERSRWEMSSRCGAGPLSDEP
ncbi:restriction endonuclease [Ralstonia chuxiongensis]|uniref:restriction endonuclease n=1 Tax=Ralstonia chuxiongensis TaxID=2957504 RepID=UPI00292F0D9E|nr:restriction endonuclease [Ralstonia chuxiongensis]